MEKRRMAAAAATALERANKLAVARNNYRVRTKPYKILKIYRTKNDSFVDVNVSLNQLGYVINNTSDSIMEMLETALRKGHGVRLKIKRADGPDVPGVTYTCDTVEIPCAKYHYSYRSVAISKEELLAWGKTHGYTPVDLFYEDEHCYKILSQYGEGIKKNVQILNYSRWTHTRQAACWSKIVRYNKMHGTHIFLDKEKYLLTKVDLFNEQDMNEFGLTKESIKELIKLAPAYGLDTSGIYRGYTLECIEGNWVKIHDPNGTSDLNYEKIAELQYCLDWLRMHNMLMPGFVIDDDKYYYEKSDAVYHGSEFAKAAGFCDVEDESALVVHGNTYYEELVFDFPTEAEDFITRRRIDDNEKADEPEHMAPPDPKKLDEVLAYERYLADCLEWQEAQHARITTSNRNVARNTLMRVLADPLPVPYTGKMEQIPHESVEETDEPLSPWELHQHVSRGYAPRKSFDEVISDLNDELDRRDIWKFGTKWRYSTVGLKENSSIKCTHYSDEEWAKKRFEERCKLLKIELHPPKNVPEMEYKKLHVITAAEKRAARYAEAEKYLEKSRIKYAAATAAYRAKKR